MRSFRPLGAVLVAAFAAAMAASPVVAQRSTTRGFTVGAHLQAGSLVMDEGEADEGVGLGLRVGHGFNRRFTGYLEFDGIAFTVASDRFGGYWGMVDIDLGTRFNFANSLRRWVPFLEAALGARVVSWDDATVNGQRVGEVDFSGGALSLGGGVSYFVVQKVALETVLKWSGGTFEKVDFGDVAFNNIDIDATSFRFKLGIAWWP